MDMGTGGYRKRVVKKAGWKHAAKQRIQVPIAATEEILEICKQLKRGEYICHKTQELNAILSEWQVNFDAEPMKSGEWQNVRKLIAEIQ